MVLLDFNNFFIDCVVLILLKNWKFSSAICLSFFIYQEKLPIELMGFWVFNDCSYVLDSRCELLRVVVLMEKQFFYLQKQSQSWFAKPFFYICIFCFLGWLVCMFPNQCRNNLETVGLTVNCTVVCGKEVSVIYFIVLLQNYFNNFFTNEIWCCLKTLTI